MRVAAVALVLILGAAVVLWFGNTLNSWVLGGLIGGLAALLLSIPISLTLFSFLSRRHDERLEAEAEAQGQVVLGRSYAYPPEAFVEVEEDAVYMLPPREEEERYQEYEDYEDRRRPQQMSPARNLPAPSSYPRLPAAGQSQASAPTNSAYQQRALHNHPPLPKQRLASPPARGNGPTSQRLSPERQVNRSGFLGSQGNAHRQHYTAALRTAQREAALRQQNEQHISSSPGLPSKKLPAVRPNLSLVEQPARRKEQRPASQQTPDQQRRARRVVDAASVAGEQTAYSQRSAVKDESITNTSRHTAQETESLRAPEPQTEYLFGHHPHTGPVRSQPQTGQTTRNPQLGDQPRNPETMTGSLRNPLVRRAPYLYDDDPLKQELAQQIDGPITRRSSLFDDQES